MLNSDDSPKKANHRSLNARVLQLAQDPGMNARETVETPFAEEVNHLGWARWINDNREALAAYNERIARHGLPLAKYRTFARELGDGKCAD